MLEKQTWRQWKNKQEILGRKNRLFSLTTYIIFDTTLTSWRTPRTRVLVMLCMYWRGNVFREPMPGNGHPSWLNSSGFQASYDVAPSLRLLVPGSLQVYRCAPAAPTLLLLVYSSHSKVLEVGYTDPHRGKLSHKLPYIFISIVLILKLWKVRGIVYRAVAYQR